MRDIRDMTYFSRVSVVNGHIQMYINTSHLADSGARHGATGRDGS